MIAPPVIGLAGAAGVGKSTVAGLLLAEARREGRFLEIVPGAPGLHAMLEAYLVEGFTMHPTLAADWVRGERKRLPCPELGGRTPTEVLQSLGDWGREKQHAEFWLALWCAKADRLLERGRGVINDSVRTAAEAAAVRDRGGVVFRLTRQAAAPLPGEAGQHVTERPVEADVELANDGAPVDTALRILALVR